MSTGKMYRSIISLLVAVEAASGMGGTECPLCNLAEKEIRAQKIDQQLHYNYVIIKSEFYGKAQKIHFKSQSLTLFCEKNHITQTADDMTTSITK
ncbi:hypothetical protein [Komagataeibacter europaeus]|uniref:hypothetical protein n=1 Tax=Komagataeibacter europaeus TaxID=33995 RepID=UPI0012DE37AB|nr:hypothetical protein [Komagataeibacter europaeus]